MRIPLITLAIVFTATAASCGADKSVSVREEVLDASAAGPSMARRRIAADVPPPAAPIAAAQAIALQQRLIRSAELAIQVENVARAVQTADSIARLRGALVADVRVNHDNEGRSDAQFVIRVPAPQFAAVLAALRGLGDIKHEAVTSEDVTREYTDVETRLAVKEDAVARLRTLLGDRTGKLSDVLEVERELARAVTELEQMKGERRYYDQRIAESAITVSLTEPGVLVRPGITAPIRIAFARSMEVLSTSVAGLIYLVTFLVPWAVIAGAVWWMVGQLRGRQRA